MLTLGGELFTKGGLCSGPNLTCLQARSCLQSEKTCLQIWNSVLGQLCPVLFILNVNRPVFLIVIYPLVVSVHLPCINWNFVFGQTGFFELDKLAALEKWATPDSE